MKVKLLVDLSNYGKDFVKGAIGDSPMKTYQRANKYYNYVEVCINGKRIDVGVDSVKCTDERYLTIQKLQREIDDEYNAIIKEKKK